MLFGVPSSKDAVGSGATDPEGILNLAIRDVVSEVGDAVVVMSDLCLDEFTDHGHCGVLAADGSVDNDATLLRYAEMGLAQAAAGAHVLGLSGMMDGQVGAVRARAGRRRATTRRRCLPTPRSTPRPSTGRSARPSSRPYRATGAPTSWTRRTSTRHCASWPLTSPRAPTSSW